MKLFLYEYATALPALGVPDSIRREGRAMFDAVRADAQAIPGLEILILSAECVVNERDAFCRLAGESDWAVIIAPETDAVLEERSRWVREAGGRFLGPSQAALQRTGDKWLTYQHWQERNVPTPWTWCPATSSAGCQPPERRPYLRKPRDGAGSCGMCLIPHIDKEADPRWLFQEYCPGVAASLTFLIGPEHRLPLLPALQRLANDGSFRYLGGDVPLPPDLARRTLTLAEKAVAAIPGLFGFVGVDVVLGDEPNGSRDYAIEINPRLTTSYVGLRVKTEDNLLGLMLALAEGTTVAPIRWKPGKVTFTASGRVERHP